MIKEPGCVGAGSCGGVRGEDVTVVEVPKNQPSIEIPRQPFVVVEAWVVVVDGA